MTYVKEGEDGEKIKAKIVKKINDIDAENHQNIKFLVEFGDGKLEEIVTYNEVCNAV